MSDQTFDKNRHSKQHNGDSHPSFLLGPLLRATAGLGGEKGKEEPRQSSTQAQELLEIPQRCPEKWSNETVLLFRC